MKREVSGSLVKGWTKHTNIINFLKNNMWKELFVKINVFEGQKNNLDARR